MTPAQQALFGTIPTDILSDVVTPPPSPSPSPQSSPASSLHSGSSSLTSLSSLSPEVRRVNYLRALQRSIHRQDGPLFMKTMNAVNHLLRNLKYPPMALDLDPFAPSWPNALKETVKEWQSGLPHKVMMRIIEELYQRCVGPHVAKLKQYEAFSSSVYGELMPSFIMDIIANTGLGPDSIFLDLGSGVGNVVIQASLQSGCKSFGIEVMNGPASVARKQLDMLKRRCRMWGVSCGDIELEEGDMLESARVSELMKTADVVLVNNKVFLESCTS
jgi:[histone H3]-lysine79 N-trimethyltransferase